MRLTKIVLLPAVSLVLALAVISCAASPTPAPAPAPPPPPQTTTAAGHPAGLKTPRLLTDAEKETIIKAALATPEAVLRLKTESKYDTKLSWMAISWDNSSPSGFSTWYGLPYDWTTDPNFKIIPPTAAYYARVVINFGEPPAWRVLVAVDPDTQKVALVEEDQISPAPVLQKYN